MVVAAVAVVHFLYPQPPRLLPPAGANNAPPVWVEATPRQAFSPMHVNVRVHQNVVDVQGWEVCVRVAGESDGDAAQSCWTADVPVAVVNRTFELRTPGAYEVVAQAAVGKGYSSNRVAINVVSNGH